jgi:hypothetical protein
LVSVAGASFPGKAKEIFLNNALMLYPAFAEVSINITLNSFAFFSPSSVETCLD